MCNEEGRENRDNCESGNSLFKAIENAVEETVGAATESIRETVSKVRSKRDNVAMVRMDDESLARLDELVECDLAGSRSEAAAFLIAEGIKARQGLFDTISEKVDEIRTKKEELRRLLDDDDETSTSESESESDSSKDAD